MQNRHPVSADTSNSVSVADIDRYGQGWLLDAEVRQFAARTVELRKMVFHKLLWYLRSKGIVCCGRLEVPQFLAYFNSAHIDEEGRWGMERPAKPVRPRTVQIYWSNLATLFKFMVEEGLIDESPLDGAKPPVCQPALNIGFAPHCVKAA
jgi:hypothetical protein